jgi:hypothetical protein
VFRSNAVAAGKMIVAGLAMFFVLTACSSSSRLPKGMVGRVGKYDYSPSVIQTGNSRQIWWCGLDHNPGGSSSRESDAILYESIDLVTGQTTEPVAVLGETAGTWDALYVCNPKVIGGIFKNPLGDGVTYKYALYYVGINKETNNNIGVAFSNDGIHWQKYPDPVIRADNAIGYGVGQPALYNSDHQSAITLFYEDSYPSTHHVEARSPDGVHFTVEGALTQNGLDPGCPGEWGDMAYDAKTKFWYALFNRAVRDPSTTGGVAERGQIGVEMYRIRAASLLTGDSPWEQVTTVDTNITGFESNFIGGLVRGSYGALNVGKYPKIQMYVSVSDPQPGWDASPKDAGKSAEPSTWDIAPAEWDPNQSSWALTRYSNPGRDIVTVGWVNPAAHFQKQQVLAHVFGSPQNGATTRLFACARGATDYFASLDASCQGQRIVGTNGFLYSHAVANQNLVALYSCAASQRHFVSTDPKCEGSDNEGLLGYAPR